MSNKNLIVLNYMLKPLAILNDDTQDSVRSIKDDLVISGVHKLSFEIPLNSEKWHYVAQDNIILYDSQLYVIQTPVINQSIDAQTITVECHHLSVNLEGKTNQAFEKTDAIAKTVRQLGSMILEGTGWVVGDVDIPDTDKRSLVVGEQSAMSNIKKMAELFDCDYKFDATLDHKKVHFFRNAIDRQLAIMEGVNLRSLNVSIDKSQLITRIYVFGGNDAITNRPITVFGAKMVDENGNPILVNGVQKIYDKTYIEDYSYYIEQGYTKSYIDAHPEFFLKESVLNMSDYINKDDLYRDAIKVMRDSCYPKIEVSFDMADKIDNENYFLHTPELNEMVYVYSEKVNSKINIKNANPAYNGKFFQLKVASVKSDSEKPESIQLVCRNFSSYGGIIQNIISNMEAINKIIQSDGTINTTKLQGWIDVLSTQLNSTQSNWYTDASGNIILENKSNNSAMKLGGGIFGLADSKNADGTWRWRSFGTGKGFTATEIVAGWLIGGKVKFDLEGGRLLIGDDWTTNYSLKFEPATGLKMKLKSNYYEFDDTGFILKDKNNNTLITPMGMANLNTDTVTDNVAEGYPLRIPVYVDPSTSVVHEVLINYTNYPFRTYSKGAATASINLTSTGSRTINLTTTNSETINLTTTATTSFNAESTTGGGSSTQTSSSATINLTSTNNGGSSTVTSVSSGSESVTSASGGGHTSGSSSKSTSDNSAPPAFYTNTETILDHPPYNGNKHYHRILSDSMTHSHGMAHTHSVKDHTHTVTTPNHTHNVAIPEHSHTITMPAHSHTVTIPEHTHSFTVPSHSHAITMPAHSHSITMPSHDHTITMPSHGHDTVFGILEQAITNNTTQVYVNGTLVSTLTNAQGVLNITSRIQTAGWHYIELRSSTMKKITATVSVKSYMTR